MLLSLSAASAAYEMKAEELAPARAMHPAWTTSRKIEVSGADESDMSESVIRVPNVLGGQPAGVETYLQLLNAALLKAAGRSIALDCAAVRWVAPFGAVVLLESCRYIEQCTGAAVRLGGMHPDIHAYLRRIDFFERAGTCAFTNDRFDPADDLNRSPGSCNVLELFPLRSLGDVYGAAAHARRILEYWLGDANSSADRIVSLLSEACSNAVEHSLDRGILTIQKYEQSGRADVVLAVGDLGQGIRNSLSAFDNSSSQADVTYIVKALHGMSSRKDRPGGLGLGAIRRIATASGGSIFIRSGTGRVAAFDSKDRAVGGLVNFPGTQVGITFRSG